LITVSKYYIATQSEFVISCWFCLLFLSPDTSDETSPSAGSRLAVSQATRAREDMVRLAVELKELEQYAAEIEEAVNREAQDGEVTAQNADQVDRELEQTSDRDDQNEVKFPSCVTRWRTATGNCAIYNSQLIRKLQSIITTLVDNVVIAVHRKPQSLAWYRWHRQMSRKCICICLLTIYK